MNAMFPKERKNTKIKLNITLHHSISTPHTKNRKHHFQQIGKYLKMGRTRIPKINPSFCTKNHYMLKFHN